MQRIDNDGDDNKYDDNNDNLIALLLPVAAVFLLYTCQTLPPEKSRALWDLHRKTFNMNAELKQENNEHRSNCDTFAKTTL